MQCFLGDSCYVLMFHYGLLIVWCFKMSFSVCILRLTFGKDRVSRHIVLFHDGSSCRHSNIHFLFLGKMARICLSMKPVVKGTTIDKFSKTVNATVESQFPIPVSNVILLLVFSQFFNAYEGNGCCSLIPYVAN